MHPSYFFFLSLCLLLSFSFLSFSFLYLSLLLFRNIHSNDWYRIWLWQWLSSWFSSLSFHKSYPHWSQQWWLWGTRSTLRSTITGKTSKGIKMRFFLKVKLVFFSCACRFTPSRVILFLFVFAIIHPDWHLLFSMFATSIFFLCHFLFAFVIIHPIWHALHLFFSHLQSFIQTGVSFFPASAIIHPDWLSEHTAPFYSFSRLQSFIQTGISFFPCLQPASFFSVTSFSRL